jgi:hypothetical protein
VECQDWLLLYQSECFLNTESITSECPQRDTYTTHALQPLTLRYMSIQMRQTMNSQKRLLGDPPRNRFWSSEDNITTGLKNWVWGWEHNT